MLTIDLSMYLIQSTILVVLLRLHVGSSDMANEISQRTIILLENGKTYKISSHDGHTSTLLLPDIDSNLEETDTRIVLYIKYIEKSMPDIKTLRVRAKDSDIFFILLYHAKSFTPDVIMDTGDRLLSIKDIHVSALLSLHTFFGPYCISSFKGKGKVKSKS